ncbi:MAG: hypothetical protein JO210_06340 [Acidobacteriaceae bacterium]|nr:hypothetical protein [Acidobacteriaceae bacterium]
MSSRFLPFWAVLSFVVWPAAAHVGSPDVYLDGNAGPYQLFVTIRPPVVIPGVAELEVRSASSGVTAMRAVPLPMTGPGARFAPVPDRLVASVQDPQRFTGSLWMMAPGSWQVRLSVEGSQGAGSLSIPVPSAALTTKRMQSGLGALLSVLGLFLVGGVVAMAGASVRESRLDPDLAPTPDRIRAGRIAMGVALIAVVAALWVGNRWWDSEATSYGQKVYKPLNMVASLSPAGLLILNVQDPGWFKEPDWHSLFTRSVDDLIPDHGHLMHLYAIRQPGLDVVYHLHPELNGRGTFRLQLPSMPAGTYKLYADIVHANGFPETMVSTLRLSSELRGRLLAGDDAAGSSSPWNQVADSPKQEFALPDGYRMIWVPVEGGRLRTKQPILFRFRLVKPDGTTPQDMALYMGMLGHAAFVKTDGTAFAHIHPTGSVSMAAFMLAQGQQASSQMGEIVHSNEVPMDMPEMSKPEANGGPVYLPNEVSFPYGLPSPGRYRIFVQMRHGQIVETGVFDATGY